MNILPKKRWHVRTRENIARVRRDEAKAAEQEREKELRIKIAETEARTELLRKKARKNYKSDISVVQTIDKVKHENEHVNLFYELEKNSLALNKSNPEYEKEKKLERERYEKQIGYLTYLGQDTNEITGNVSWYNKDPEDRKNVKEEVSKNAKALEDPLTQMRKYLGNGPTSKVTKASENNFDSICERKRTELEDIKYIPTYEFKGFTDKKKLKKKKRKKKKRKYSSDSDNSETDKNEDKEKVDIATLRAKRIKREMEERKRAELVFQKLNGGKAVNNDNMEIEQKYNSQFNPHLAKQNFANR